MKKIIYLILPIAILILEILPFGAVLNFASAPEEVVTETFSYFSLVPLGYANIGPFITAILSCILLLISLIYVISRKGKRVLNIVSIIAFCFSLLPILFGIEFFSAVGILISLLLLTFSVFTILCK